MWLREVMWQVKNIICPISQFLWLPNLTGWLYIMRSSQPWSHMALKSNGLVTTIWIINMTLDHVTLTMWPTWVLVRNWKSYISTLTRLIVTQLGGGGNLSDEHLSTESYEFLITWECWIMKQIKDVIHPLLQDRWPPNFTELWLNVRGSQKVTRFFDHMIKLIKNLIFPVLFSKYMNIFCCTKFLRRFGTHKEVFITFFL